MEVAEEGVVPKFDGLMILRKSEEIRRDDMEETCTYNKIRLEKIVQETHVLVGP